MESVLGAPYVAELYKADPSDFTAARNALVKSLKKEGKKDEAAAVVALKRPTKVAAAINAISASHQSEIHALFNATNEVAAAQSDSISTGDASTLRTSVDKRRKLLKTLTDAVLETTGESYRDEIVSTFEAASSDEDSAALLVRGVLSSSLQADNVFGFGGIVVPSSVKAEGDTVARQREIKQREAALQSAGERVSRAESDLEAAQIELSRVQEWVERAELTLRDARDAEREAKELMKDAKSKTR